jgi:hypothetical protein
MRAVLKAFLLLLTVTIVVGAIGSGIRQQQGHREGAAWPRRGILKGGGEKPSATAATPHTHRGGP